MSTLLSEIWQDNLLIFGIFKAFNQAHQSKQGKHILQQNWKQKQDEKVGGKSFGRVCLRRADGDAQLMSKHACCCDLPSESVSESCWTDLQK